MHRRPLLSFSILSQIYGTRHSPNPQHHKPQPPAAIAKPEVIALPASPASPASLPPLEKKKFKITVAKKTSASTSASAAAPPMSPVPAPPSAPASPAPVSVSPRTKKIKITIKQQPKQQPKQQKQEQQRVDTCYHLHDFAPPASMIYTPCGDYIAPPQKCCRFFIENRHCFLRSADNACIDPITKEVFGFWNCEIGKKCELLPPPPTDDDQNDDDHDDHVQLDINNDDFNKIDALAMRKKSDANRARITGQPVALLRQKIATKYGML